jgi:hypothetical protein
MKRTSVSTKSADLFGTGRDGFTDGVPSVTPSTVLESSVMNAHQEELARAIELNGTALRAAAYDQLARVAGFRAELRELLNPAGTLDTGGANAMRAVACDNAGKCVFVGDGGKIFSMDAFDGSTLTSRTAGSAYAGNFKDVVWHVASSLFIAVGASGEIQTSPSPGTTWTRRVTSGGVAGTGNVLRVSQNISGRLTAITDDSGVNVTSTDGVTWTANTAINGGTWLGTAIACDARASVGVWVAIGQPSIVWDRTKNLYRSTDGLTWSAISLTSVLSTNEGVVDLVVSPSGRFCAKVLASGDNTQAILASDDGTTWTCADDITNTASIALAAAKCGYVATPQSGAFAANINASSDGYTWKFQLLVNPMVAHGRLQCIQTNNTYCWIALGITGDAGKMTKSPAWGY